MQLNFSPTEDATKTKGQLLNELIALRQQIAKLQATQAEHPAQTDCQTVNSLEGNESLLRQVIQYAPAAIALLDTQMRYLMVSQRWLSDFHLGDRDILGWSHYDVFPNLSDAYKAAHQRCLLGATEQCDEDSLVLSDGTFEWIRWEIQPWHQVDDTVGGLIIFSERLTQHKQAQQALQAANQQVINTLESISDAFVAFDRDWRFTYVNDEAEKFLQTSRHDLLGKHVWHEVFPDSRGVFYQTLHHAIAEQTPVQFEEFSPHFNRWVETHAYPSPEGLAVYFRDISECKQSEEALQQSTERLRLALDAGGMGTWEWDMQANIQYWDATQYRLFGLEETTELTTDTFFRLVHPDDLPQVRRSLDTVLQQGGSFATEFRIIRPDGTVRWLASKGGILLNSNGKPQRMIGVNFDISERKQTEAEREQILEREQTVRAEAEAANRVKDEFLAVLSHELRSPLNPILGWSKLLQTRTLSPEKTQQALETIERNAKVQAQLVEDLLDISRILQGKLSLNICPVDLVTTVEAAIETMRLSIDAKALDLQFIVLDAGSRSAPSHQSEIADQLSRSSAQTSDCPVPRRSNFLVLGDVNRLQQVVWNLLSNAVKFTPPTGRIEICLERTKTHARLTISDSGQGIHASFLPHVFEYFRQADSSTTRQFGGLGLGLAIVRHLVELHGGSVKAESHGIGQGARFTILLPLRDKAEEPQTNDSTAEQPTQPLRNMQILIVDDEADNLELVRFILEQSGATVLAASSAQAALNWLNKSQPDLLVADIGMPEIDGCMLLRQMRRRFSKEIPAIALTAFAREDDRRRVLAAGFQSHLTKPVDPAELIAVVTNLVQRARK